MTPKQYLEHYSRIYREAWKQVDGMRSDRGKKLPWWPEWCFLPLAGSLSIVNVAAIKAGIDVKGQTILVNDAGIIGALAAWRVTQGVYRFDPDVFNSVINTPVVGNIPHDVFFNLPEWCVYIETPGLKYLEGDLLGFFAYLEYDIETHQKELRLVLNYELDGKSRLFQHILHLGSWDISESIDLALQQGSETQEDLIELSQLPHNSLPKYTRSEVTQEVKSQIEALISLLLYLCSVNGEIGNQGKRHENPKPKKTKKGSRLFPPNSTRTWDVGVRMGAAIRSSNASSSYHSDGIIGNNQDRVHYRTHIRRAHWHGFWSGPRDVPEEQKYSIKWMYPLVINPSKDDIPIVIRPVK